VPRPGLTARDAVIRTAKARREGRRAQVASRSQGTYDGPVISGNATLARTQEHARIVMTRLLRGDKTPAWTKDGIVEVTITAPDPAWLTDLCHQLVVARLAASAHVIQPITSLYRWKGAVHQAAEARASLRSRFELLVELTAFVVERHPYEVPNITAVGVVGGNPAYLSWVRDATSNRSSAP
jgi:periplasmic divalent cation tolerance protein